MTSTQAKIIKIGNSYGIRINRSAMRSLNAHLGDSLDLQMQKAKKPDKTKALAGLRKLAKSKGALKNISDPVNWQRNLRAEWDEREIRELNTT